MDGGSGMEGMGSNRRAYWTCQLVGWTAVATLSSGMAALFGNLSWSVLALQFSCSGIFLLGTHLSRALIHRRGWLGLSPAPLAPRILLLTFAIAVTAVALTQPWFMDRIPPEQRVGAMVGSTFSSSVIVLMWFLTYFGYHYFRAGRRAEEEQWRLQLAMRDTELSALRTQLNPHFLFNSLNSLRGLIAEQPAKAQEAVTALASLLRHTLRMSQSRTISLRSELDAARHYLELERIRFEERLEYEIEADPVVLDQEVPPMLIQTLVENAVKHGISRLPRGGRILVTAAQEGVSLRIEVRNTGRLLDPGEDGGVGLANSLDRLRLLFGERAAMSLEEDGPGEVVCRVTVPARPRAVLSSSTEEAPEPDIAPAGPR